MFFPYPHLNQQALKKFWQALPWCYKVVFASQTTLLVALAIGAVLGTIALIICLLG